jgi:chromosome segregation ATPase
VLQQVQQERNAEQLRFARELQEAHPSDACARLTRKVELLTAAKEAVERQFCDYRRSQSAEREQLLATHNSELETENVSHLAEILRLRTQVSDLEGQLDSVTVTGQRTLGELKQSFALKEIEYEAMLARLRNSEKAVLAAQLETLRNECRSLRMEISIFKSKQSALVDESIEDIKDQRKWTEAVVDENCQLKYRISKLLMDKSFLADEMSDLTPLVQSKEIFDENRRLVKENAQLTESKAELEASKQEMAELIGELKADLASGNSRGSEISRLEQEKFTLQVTINQMTTDLNSQLHALQIVNADLTTSNELLERDKSEMETVNCRLSNEKAELELKILNLQATNNRLSELQSEVIAVGATGRIVPVVSDFGSQTRAIEDKGIAELQEQVDDLREENAQLRIELGTLSENNAQILLELRQSDAKTSEFRLVNQSLETRLAILQRQSAELNKVGRSKCEGLYVGEMMGFELFSDRDSPGSELQMGDLELLAEIKRLTDLAEAEANKVAKLTHENSELEQEMQAIKGFSDHRLKLLLRERAEIEAHMQNENDLLQQELDRIREQQAESSDREFELQRKVELLRQKVLSLSSKHQTETDFLRARLEALDGGSVVISPQLADLRDRQAELEQALEAAHRQLSEKVSELRSFEVRAKTGTDGQLYDSKIEQLSLENSDLRTFNQSLAEQYEELRREDVREISELRHTVEKLKSRIGRLKLNDVESKRKCSQCEVLKETLAEAQSEIKNCQRQVAQLTNHNQTLIDQIADLNASLDRGRASSEDSTAAAMDDGPPPRDFIAQRFDEARSGAGSSDHRGVSPAATDDTGSGVSQKQLVRLIGMLWLQSLERGATT